MLNPLLIYQAIVLAIGQIWANKTRSFLTTLGIIIGVASVTAVIAALTGLKTKVLTEFETFGANKMFIFPDRPDDAPRNKYPWQEIRLKPENCGARSARYRRYWVSFAERALRWNRTSTIRYFLSIQPAQSVWCQSVYWLSSPAPHSRPRSGEPSVRHDTNNRRRLRCRTIANEKFFRISA